MLQRTGVKRSDTNFREREALMSDEEIIKKVLAGETNEYRHLVSNYKDMVFAMIMRQTGNREIAEELAQETFIKAYTGLKHFRFDSKFSTWLVRIALNNTNSYFTSKAYRQKVKTESLDLAAHDMGATDVDQEREMKEQMMTFRECLSQQKPKFRDVIVLCGLEGKSYEEAAEAIDIPVGTVRSRLNKARLLLKECMIEKDLAGETA